MSTPVISVQKIRVFLMDRPELNTLKSGDINFTDEMIEDAILHVVDYFNLMKPPIRGRASVETFPSPALLLIGVSGHLLMSMAVHNALNQYSYAADDSSETDKDKAPLYQALGSQLWAEFKELAQNLKVQINIAAAYGMRNSEYKGRDWF